MYDTYDTVYRYNIIENTLSIIEIYDKYIHVSGAVNAKYRFSFIIPTQTHHHTYAHTHFFPSFFYYNCTLQVFLTASQIVSTCGIAACSKLIAYGIGTSAPVTRSTGASK